MSIIPVFVGLDYHQDSVQVCVLDSEGLMVCNRSVANDASTIKRVIKPHGEPERVAIEACCGASDLAEELISQHGLKVQLAHPGYVNRMKRSPDKTDFGDAQLLADLIRVNYLPNVWLAPRSIRELRRLVRHRSQLVCRRKDVKLRIRALLRENRLKCRSAKAWTKDWYAWLQQAELSESDQWVLNDHLEEIQSLVGRISSVEARIHVHVQDDPWIEQLMALPGVGLVTAVTLRAEIGRFDRFQTGKQLARFCGVTPRNASSGARQADAGLIKAGNPELRKVLTELAQRLVHRIKGRWMKLAAGMLERGKKKNVVVAAIANRWVRWLYHQIQNPTSARAQQKGHAPSTITVTPT